ncbi:anthrone oxygenase family protein [Streptomyces sp. NPDC059897]|uniref:anthrone oxygenase family protein n=1 Tax=Streptomyces sp. NPDC059897 TaxID=3346994 RepID=UPI00364B2757
MSTSRSTRIRLVHGMALLATGLLAGAFGYGAANLVPTFDAVPQQMRFDFHTELMKVNGITVQGAMTVSALSSLALAALLRGRHRAVAATAFALTLASFLVTRFGNVPINGRIKQWAAHGPSPDAVELLQRWELFNIVRTLTAVVAFSLLIGLALRSRGPESGGAHSTEARASPGAASGAR